MGKTIGQEFESLETFDGICLYRHRALLLCTQMSGAIPTSLGLIFPPLGDTQWVCPVLFKRSNRSQFTHLATSKNEYLCDCDCTRRDRCTPVRVPAATASPFLSQGEAPHHTTRHGRVGGHGDTADGSIRLQSV